MKYIQCDFRFTLREKLQCVVMDILVLIYKANREQAKGESLYKCVNGWSKHQSICGC